MRRTTMITIRKRMRLTMRTTRKSRAPRTKIRSIATIRSTTTRTVTMTMRMRTKTWWMPPTVSRRSSKPSSEASSSPTIRWMRKSSSLTATPCSRSAVCGCLSCALPWAS
uniref:(northern house mosquito) hypothetical protein n=1 Tax=Culex pipiens TaxID=7175 RepID=A0A8D8FST7_CULPI